MSLFRDTVAGLCAEWKMEGMNTTQRCPCSPRVVLLVYLVITSCLDLIWKPKTLNIHMYSWTVTIMLGFEGFLFLNFIFSSSFSSSLSLSFLIENRFLSQTIIPTTVSPPSTFSCSLLHPSPLDPLSLHFLFLKRVDLQRQQSNKTKDNTIR